MRASRYQRHRQVLAVPHAAEDLHRAVDHAAEHVHCHARHQAALAEQAFGVEHHIVEPQLGVARAAQAHHRLFAAEGAALQALVDKKERDFLATLGFAGDGGNKKEVAHQAVADEVLVAAEVTAAAVFQGRPGGDACGVRAGIGLGDRDRADAIAAHGGPQPALDLVLQRCEFLADEAADEAADGVDQQALLVGPGEVDHTAVVVAAVV